MISIIKLLLFPLSLIYGCIVAIRNFCYDKGWFKSYEIPGKSIVVGNLSMGGTGKSPHTLYLWNLLSQSNDVAILSRGYGRDSKGLIELTEKLHSNEVGDEPLMFKKNIGNRGLVVVSESREKGVKYIRQKQTDAIILLDDAFQHRKVKAGFSILLTDYKRPYFSDFVVPSGTLREFRSGKKRADCVVVTKCPHSITDSEKVKITAQLKFKNNAIFFSSVKYGEMISFGKKIEQPDTVLLVTGIASPKPLEEYLSQFYKVESLVFKDHHQYTITDLLKIHSKFDTFTSDKSILVTTEKDFVRLDSILTDEQKQKYPWYYQSITVEIDREEQFNNLINNYVDTI